MSLPTEDTRRNSLGSAEVRRMLTEFVRRKVPAADVDDVVQMVLLDALASKTAPDAEDAFQKWLIGVARHKIADFHRKGSREKPAELGDIETVPPPVEEHELVRWAEREAGKSSKDGARTLGWMAREGEGDKLEHIAAEEKLPAATVRQRVSRMRRFMRERWMAEVAAFAVLSIIGILVYRALRTEPPVAGKDPAPPIPTGAPTTTATPDSPSERAVELRRVAFDACNAGDWARCEKALDDARNLDRGGEADPRVNEARAKIAAARSPAPTVSAPSALPTATTTSPTTTSPTSTSPTTAPTSPTWIPNEKTHPPPKPSPTPTSKGFDKKSGKPTGPSTSFGSDLKP